MGNEQYLVLVVEDSEDDLAVYSHFLKIRGFRVATSTNGREGLQKALQLQPDVILLDLWLPEIGGWEATKRLKSDERTKHIPIVVITGHSYVQADVISSDALVVKPCLPIDLENEILKVLGTHAKFSANSRPDDERKGSIRAA